jgi:NAD-dependent deacetylase
MPRKKLIVLTGAGISAESGLKTFRDADGLWEGHSIQDVATPEAFQRNPGLVHDFYNQRRKQLLEVEPNKAHLLLAELEEFFEVHIITQNVDDLHERAGSSQVLHLHGELKKVRSTGIPSAIYELNGWELKTGDLCENGFQLRPHIVWFGEAVPAMYDAELLCQQADLLLVIGTSLQVYPAAGLIYAVDRSIPRFYIDPKARENGGNTGMELMEETAVNGMQKLMGILKSLA